MPSVAFLSPSGEGAPPAPPLGHPRRPLGKPPRRRRRVKWRRKKNWGAWSAPHWAVLKKKGACGALNDFKNYRRTMRLPNMCLVLKLDNGKVVSIANEQTESQTESCQHPVPYSNIDILALSHIVGACLSWIRYSLTHACAYSRCSSFHFTSWILLHVSFTY